MVLGYSTDQNRDVLLKKHFGFKSFREGQFEIIESILSGRDTLAILPTGAGKSLCYQYPSKILDGIVIVVSPLVALMRDQVKSLREINLRGGYLCSDQSIEEKRIVFGELKRGGQYILFLSPERLQKRGFRAWIASQNILFFVVDEAHCMVQWGNHFRPDYGRLGLLRELRGDIPIMAMTASATSSDINEIACRLGLISPKVIVTGFYRSNLFCAIEKTFDDQSKDKKIIGEIKKIREGKVIVYCGTRSAAERVAACVALKIGSVGVYHAGLPIAQRNEIQQKFSEGKIKVLVATNAFGMGVDIADVRLLIHYNFPATIEAYYQEIGRAGRDGLKSKCLLYYSTNDIGLQAYFVRSSEQSKDQALKRWKDLDAMINFLEEKKCRHVGLLRHFGERSLIESCGHCDRCID